MLITKQSVVDLSIYLPQGLEQYDAVPQRAAVPQEDAVAAA